MLFEVMIPAKFCPDAVIIPVFPDVLLNLKLPAVRLLSLIRLSRTKSAENVETPTALCIYFTSLNPKEVTFVMILPFGTPLTKKDSSFRNLPLTSVKLKS